MATARRRNPLTKDIFNAVMGEWKRVKPESALGRAIAADPVYAQSVFEMLANIIVEAEAAKAAAEHSAQAEASAAKAEALPAAAVTARGADVEGPLTDRQAWTMLADLVDTALADLTAEERSALKAAFREEASRASA
jgi:hypothetical protein